MRVLVAGASGVIGQELLPLLTSVGHEVIGFGRTHRGAPDIVSNGGRFMALDALDAQMTAEIISDIKPDAVVNLLTAIPSRINPRKMADDFAVTNRLRTQGTKNVFYAAMRAGAKRFISQGLAYPYEAGAGSANEDVPLWSNPPKQFRTTLDALNTLERQTEEYNGTVLRFGHLYGPGTIYAPTGSFASDVRARKVPLVGGGTSTFSFTHIHDAATAILGALDKQLTGPLNIVDDDPTEMNEWLPEMARMLGAPSPKSAPALLARMAVGGWGVAFMTRLRGADNSRARLQLDWRPRYSSWREGFTQSLSATPPATG